MKTAKTASAVVLALALAAACVSPGTDDSPEGGVDVTFQPSAATLGTPFVTPDGWTITVHRFILRLAAMDVTRLDDGDGGNATGGGDGPIVLLAPSPSCHLRLFGATAGDSADVSLVMPELYVDNDVGQVSLPPCGVDAETVTRFSQPGEGSGDLELPDLLLEADAVKGTQHLTVSLTVAGGVTSDSMATVVIRANVGVPVVFPVHAEAMFVAGDDPLGVRFSEVALADVNGDGVVTGAEVAATTRRCGATGRYSGDAVSDDGSSGDDDDGSCNLLIFDLMGHNAAEIFGDAPPPP